MCFPRFLIDRVKWSNPMHRLIRWLPRPVCVFHLWAWSPDGTVDFSESPSFVATRARSTCVGADGTVGVSRSRRLYNDTRAFHLWAWSADGTASGLLQESVVCTTTRVQPVGIEC